MLIGGFEYSARADVPRRNGMVIPESRSMKKSIVVEVEVEGTELARSEVTLRVLESTLYKGIRQSVSSDRVSCRISIGVAIR